MSKPLNTNILGQNLEAKANQSPDKLIFTFENGDYPEETQTYRQLHENSHKLSRALLDAGLDTGDRFAAMMRNHPEMVHSLAAASILGTVMVPLDPRLKGDRLAHQIVNSESKALLISADLLAELEAIREKVPGLKTIWVAEKPGFSSTGNLSKYRPMDSIWDAPFNPVNYRVDNPMAPLEIIYTSGTTGDPKGVVCENMRLSFYSFLGNFFGYADDFKLYNGLSLTHGNAQAVTFAPAINRGLSAVFSVKFTKSRLWDITRKYNISSFSLLGGMMAALFNEPPKPNDADNPVKVVVSAGTPRAIWEDFERRFNVKILEWYGSVEGGFAFKPLGAGPIGSFGKPVEVIMEMLVLDDDDKPCPPEVPGELVARPKMGGGAKVEYFKNPEASEKKTRGGWLRTGDICHADKDGWLFFDYRKGGGLRRSGDFIQPDYVEKVIGLHPDVSEVAVYGVPSRGGAPGESDIVAAIKLFEGRKFNPASIFDTCRKGLEPNSVPSYLQHVAEIPKTISEKPQERFLKKLFEEQPENIHKSENYPAK